MDTKNIYPLQQQKVKSNTMNSNHKQIKLLLTMLSQRLVVQLCFINNIYRDSLTLQKNTIKTFELIYDSHN